jgi:NAD(P)H-flavin reductase
MMLDVQGCLQVKRSRAARYHKHRQSGLEELSEKIAQDTLNLITDDWRQQLVTEVLEQAKSTGIEFDQVLIAGVPLVQDHVLNPAIRHSRLESVATLKNLTVAGDVSLADTVHVKPRRLGVNTWIRKWR